MLKNINILCSFYAALDKTRSKMNIYFTYRTPLPIFKYCNSTVFNKIIQRLKPILRWILKRPKAMPATIQK